MINVGNNTPMLSNAKKTKQFTSYNPSATFKPNPKYPAPRDGIPGLPSAEELAKKYGLPTTNYWGEPVSYADVFRQLPWDKANEELFRGSVNAEQSGINHATLGYRMGAFAKPAEYYYYGWNELPPSKAGWIAQQRQALWEAVRRGWDPFSDDDKYGYWEYLRNSGGYPGGAGGGFYPRDGGGGGAGGAENPYTKTSGSQSFSWSFAGIPYDLLSTFTQFADKKLGLLGSLMDTIESGEGSSEVFGSLDKYNQLALNSWRRARADLVNAMMKEGITSLANRGVLDSSVATGLLSNIARQNLQDLSKFQSQLGLNQIMQSLYYPLDALKAISRPYTDIAGLTKFAISGSQSESQGYDPSPWVSLIMALAGI